MKLLTGILLSLLIQIGFSQSYSSLLWKIEGNDLKSPSYLFGTMHIQDERVFHFSESFTNAFEQSEVFALELNMDSVNSFVLMQEMIMDSNKVLKDFYSEPEYDTITRFFSDSLHLNLTLFERMTPFFVEQFITSSSIKQQKEEALDLYLFNQAKNKGKKIVGLETMDEQINTFKSIPLQTQAKSLLESVRNYNTKNDEEIEKMIEWYSEGKLDSLASITTNIYEDSSTQELFIQKFLVERNKKMTKRIIPLINKKSIFIAVGAAHLPGKLGIIELLRSNGYTLTPIK